MSDIPTSIPAIAASYLRDDLGYTDPDNAPQEVRRNIAMVAFEDYVIDNELHLTPETLARDPIPVFVYRWKYPVVGHATRADVIEVLRAGGAHPSESGRKCLSDLSRSDLEPGSFFLLFIDEDNGKTLTLIPPEGDDPDG